MALVQAVSTSDQIVKVIERKKDKIPILASELLKTARRKYQQENQKDQPQNQYYDLV
jgi:hypothetical protein